MAKYYQYHIPKSFFTVLIGNDKQQIIDTMKFYHQTEKQLRVPEEKQIHEVNSLEIRCCLPLMSEKFSFRAEIMDGVTFDLNANAVNYLQGIALGYKLLKRGSLYKFEPGLSELGLYFLPEDIMVSLGKYDWSKHKDIIEKRSWK